TDKLNQFDEINYGIALSRLGKIAENFLEKLSLAELTLIQERILDCLNHVLLKFGNKLTKQNWFTIFSSLRHAHFYPEHKTFPIDTIVLLHQQTNFFDEFSANDLVDYFYETATFCCFSEKLSPLLRKKIEAFVVEKQYEVCDEMHLTKL